MSPSLLKKLDIYLLVAFPILALIVSLVFSTNFFVSTLLFFGPISLWLSFRTPRRVLKTLIFTVVFGLPMLIAGDYLALINGAWVIPTSIFPRVGIIVIEDLVWGLL